MRNEYIFDILETDGDIVDIGTVADADFPLDLDGIKSRVSAAIAAEKKLRKSGGRTAKRLFMVAAAAAVVAGVIFLGSSMVLGRDNYDFYSEEAQAAKAGINAKYENAYKQFLADNDFPQTVFYDETGFAKTDMAEFDAKHQAFDTVFGELINIIKDEAFTVDKVRNYDDEFIDRCCSVFKGADISVYEKTLIYMYLEHYYTDHYDPENRNVDKNKALIEKTLMLAERDAFLYSDKEINDMVSEMESNDIYVNHDDISDREIREGVIGRWKRFRMHRAYLESEAGKAFTKVDKEFYNVRVSAENADEQGDKLLMDWASDRLAEILSVHSYTTEYNKDELYVNRDARIELSSKAAEKLNDDLLAFDYEEQAYLYYALLVYRDSFCNDSTIDMQKRNKIITEIDSMTRILGSYLKDNNYT